MMVALALFALISIAGAALINSVLGARERVQQRLERLADLQRAMYLLDADFRQISPAPIAEEGSGVSFARHAGAAGDQAVSYALQSGVLVRTIGGTRQPILADVRAVRWSFLDPPAGWRPHWPPDPRSVDRWPAAITIELDLAPGKPGPGGMLRRVIPLPAMP